MRLYCKTTLHFMCSVEQCHGMQLSFSWCGSAGWGSVYRLHQREHSYVHLLEMCTLIWKWRTTSVDPREQRAGYTECWPIIYRVFAKGSAVSVIWSRWTSQLLSFKRYARVVCTVVSCRFGDGWEDLLLAPGLSLINMLTALWPECFAHSY